MSSRRAEIKRRSYILHKEARHGGESDIFCLTCAEFEYELMPNKTRRDSE